MPSITVFSHKVASLNVLPNTNSLGEKANTNTQNKSHEQSLPEKQQINVELSLNTDKYLNTGKSADNMAVFDHLLSKAYLKLSEAFAVSPEVEAKMSGVIGYNDGQPVTAEKASNNILGFIERRIMLDKADGASQEELESRLAAGLEGFEKGFSEAKEQLEALSLLSPTIAVDIEKTYDLVHNGIDKLKEKYLGIKIEADSKTSIKDIPLGSPEASISANVNVTRYLDNRGVDSKSDNNSVGLIASTVESSLDFANDVVAQRNSFRFELKTLDGDTVSIRATAQQLNVSEEAYERSSKFDLQVTGELDDGELKAINDLLSQVNNLADTFYSGDMSKAFDQALSVGYNSEEIAQFALTLTHSEVKKSADTYEKNSSEKSLEQSLQPISDFVEQVLSSIEKAKDFGNSIELIQQLTSGVDKLEVNRNDNESSKPTRFVDFVRITVRLENEK